MILSKDGLIQNEFFIVFGEDYDRHPHALEHLMKPLFPSNQVLWVETIGLRSPRLTLYDLKRILEKIKNWINLSRKTNKTKSYQENFSISSPFMIPFTQYQLIRKFNKWSVLRNVQKHLKLKNIKNPITITSVPNSCDFVGSFLEKFIIYYCVDEFSLWPGLNESLVKNFEEKLISNSNLLIVTSESLANVKKIDNKTTAIINHGVDFDHFDIGENKVINANLKLCYFGLFDERSDQKIFCSIAENIKNCEIHIFGDVVCDIKKMKSYQNIIFHGKINYTFLPEAIKEMDIFLLPYIRNDLSECINPLKLKEYLATGRPVIATALPEVLKLKDYLFIGSSGNDFVSIIYKLQKSNQILYSKKTTTFIKENETWDKKAKELSVLIQKSFQA